jgi:hypothetical protein
LTSYPVVVDVLVIAAVFVVVGAGNSASLWLSLLLLLVLMLLLLLLLFVDQLCCWCLFVVFSFPLARYGNPTSALPPYRAKHILVAE